MKIDTATCRDFSRSLSLEWLETNGRGGFSSGTVAGANTRRYHALLLTARHPPCERFVLVNQLEEWLDLDGQSFPLSTNCYPGAVHPSGYQICTGFSSGPWPTWVHRLGAGYLHLVAWALPRDRSPGKSSRHLPPVSQKA